MIELRSLKMAFLKKTLFKDAHLRLFSGERYGVVGANGSGKSTLLKIITGDIKPDDGEVYIKPHATKFRIGQNHHLDDNEKIIETAMKGKPEVLTALRQQESLLKNEESSGSNANEIAKLQEVIEDKNGYLLRPKAEQILEGLGIKSEMHEKPLGQLSGGFKWRVYLAQVLVNNPNILMLDEPTNHLDIISITWLEDFLHAYKGLVILVSHDIRFLNNVCTTILDIDFETIKSYKGNYKAYLKARRLYLEQKEKENIAKEKDIAQKKAFIEKFRYKASKARQAQSRIKQIDRIVIEAPLTTSRIHPKFKFEACHKGSKDVLMVKHLSKSYKDKAILKDFSFDVRRGQKVAVIGPNGAGKSTLIKALALEFKECNDSVFWGHGVNLSYFPQDCGKIIKEKKISVLDWLWQYCSDKPQSFVQGMLGRVLFSKDDVKKITTDLSGGELSRLYLAKLMIEQPNVLLLDEPTNHLDIESIESLKDALKRYSGTLIFVSHDRNFIDDICDHVIEISKNDASVYVGNYSEFLEKKGLDLLEHESAGGDESKSSHKSENKQNYEERKLRRAKITRLKKQLDNILHSMQKKETELEDIKAKFLDPNLYKKNDYKEIATIENEKCDIEKELEELLAKWESLENKLNDLNVE